MRYFAVLIQVTDYQSAKSTLLNFKKNMNEQGEVVVFDLSPENYDFLYNSFIEKSNKEHKQGRDP